jgi:hypothetical protein
MIGSHGNSGAFDDSFDHPLDKRLSQLQFMLQCSNADFSGPCQENGSFFTLWHMSVKLDDSTPPRILSSSGSLLAGGGPQRGELQVVLKLADAGGGLYRTRVLVDGERLDDRPIDDDQGVCKRPFVTPVPCKLAATVALPIDTTRLSDGPHAITIRVFDATGVNSAVLGPISILADNVPDPLPRGTAACPPQSVATLRRRLKEDTVRFGGAASIVGRVLAAHTSLKGARVGIVDNPSFNEPPRLARVGRRGRFHLKLRPRFSTRVQPILVSAAGEAQACGKPLKVDVRAGVRLTTSPRHLRNGESIRMRGRVSNLRLPPTGKTVLIQARARGVRSWTTVTLIRSDRAGRFRFTYRFRKTFRTTTYEFRAVAPRERRYPYLKGWSRTRRATVSP